MVKKSVIKEEKEKNKKIRPILKNEDDERKLFAFIVVLLSIVGFLIAFIAKREDKYIMFYAKQSLILFIAGLVTAVLVSLVDLIIIGKVIIPLIWIFYVVLWVIALINSISGEMKETPIIGIFAENINL